LDVNMLSIVYMIVYASTTFFASWSLDHKSLRFGFICGSILTLLGGWLRVLSFYGYGYCMLGQTIAAIGQSFILNAPPKLASNWFSDSQRTIATSISSVAAPVGVGLGFLISPAIATDASQVPTMILYEAIIVSIMVVPSCIFFRDKPPTPPSASASPVRSDDFIQSLRDIFTNPSFLIVMTEFALVFGAYNTLATIINQLILPYGYSNDDAGTLGALTIFLGIVGAGVAGLVVDKWKIYKWSLAVSLFFGTLSFALFTIFLMPNWFVGLCIAVSLGGFFNTAVIPISLELACEVSYPIGEGTPTGILMAMGNVVAIILTVGSDKMINGEGLVTATSWLMVACMGGSFIVSLFFYGKLKRIAHDQKDAESKSPKEQTSFIHLDA